jgi:predicted transcriptional regulator
MSHREVQIHVGEGLSAAGARFVDAWRRAEQGDLTSTELHVSFESWERFTGLMTTQRLSLLRHLHHHPAGDVRALAAALQRDEAEVAVDVDALVGAGLIDRHEKKLSAEYDSVRVETRIAL